MFYSFFKYIIRLFCPHCCNLIVCLAQAGRKHWVRRRAFAIFEGNQLAKVGGSQLQKRWWTCHWIFYSEESDRVVTTCLITLTDCALTTCRVARWKTKKKKKNPVALSVISFTALVALSNYLVCLFLYTLSILSTGNTETVFFFFLIYYYKASTWHIAWNIEISK